VILLLLKTRFERINGEAHHAAYVQGGSFPSNT
jgi:hypothetical protein